MTQKETNPYPFSDSNKRYQTFDYYMKHRFGRKCAKVSLDAGFTCPNLDGTISVGGCIYCADGSSGAACAGSISRQYDEGVKCVVGKWQCSRFVPYLQAHTNTYAEPDVLRRVYEEAASLPGAVMLAIATRADCLSDKVLQVLSETAKKIPLLIELGLQSTDDETARIINRGHDMAAFCSGYERLRQAEGDITVCVHLINGLPGESMDTMLKSAEDVAALKPDMVKLHLLHVLKGTYLENLYLAGSYTPMTMVDYVSAVCSQIERMPPETVIARVTGDGKATELLAPDWSIRKTAVTNEIDKELFRRGTYQGCRYKL